MVYCDKLNLVYCNKPFFVVKNFIFAFEIVELIFIGEYCFIVLVVREKGQCMGTVFIKVLNLSITAGWLVLAVILLRLIFRKGPKWIFCILWALVGIRLLLPVSFESMFSLVPSAETVPEDIIYSESPQIHTGFEVANSIVNPVISDSFAPNLGDSVNPLQILTEIIGIIWLIGMGVMLLVALISYLKMRKKISASILRKVETVDSEMADRYRVFESDDVDSPFVLGLFRPRIYVPSGMDDTTFESVYAHEMAHIRRRDFLWKPLGFLILTVYWFNPLMWLAYVLLCRDIEAACDEKVVNNMDRTERALYSQALLNCGTHVRRFSVCPLAFGETGVKSRVKSVLNYKKPAFWIIIIAIVACIVVGICFLTNPKTKADADEGKMGDEVSANNEGKYTSSWGIEYSKLKDGTYLCEGIVYKYKYELTGRIPNSTNDSIFVYLSNLENMTFDQAWIAQFSSTSTAQFSVEEARLLSWEPVTKDDAIIEASITDGCNALFSDYMSNQEKIIGLKSDEVLEKYGEPTSRLSGFWGDCYTNDKGETLILYYDSDTWSVSQIKRVVPSTNTGYAYFKRVLSGEEKFCYHQDGTEQLLTIDDVPAMFDPYDSYMKISYYAFCDMDGDGIEEAVLQVNGTSGDMGGKIILHYINNKVYAYKTNYRNIWELKEDGTYLYSEWIPTNDGCARITEFTENGFTEDRFTYETGDYNGADTFVVNHKEIDNEGGYLNALKMQKGKISVNWYEFEKEFFMEPNPTQTPSVDDASSVDSGMVTRDENNYNMVPNVLFGDGQNSHGKVYICTDDYVNPQTKLANNSLQLKLYSDGTATYSQPIYSSHIPMATWSVEGNILAIKDGPDGAWVTYLEIVDDGLKFIEKGSSGFMFYPVPDGTLFKWEYDLTDGEYKY